MTPETLTLAPETPAPAITPAAASIVPMASPDRATLAVETQRQPGGVLDPESWIVPTGDRLATFLKNEPDQARVDRFAYEWMQDGINAQTKGQGGGIAEEFKNGLRVYRDFRKARGEEPFAYLPAAKTRTEEKAARDQVPFFRTLFSDPAKMAEAFPEDQRQAFDERFVNSLDPVAEKHRTAGVMLVSTMLKKPVEEVADLWPAYRSKYAAEHLGLSGKIDDATFYQAAGKAFDKEASDDETARSIAQQAQAAAIQGRPLSYAIEKGKAVTGEEWKRFAPAARAGYASILSEFSDGEIKAGRALFEAEADMSGNQVDDIAKGDGTRAAWVIALEAYGNADQAGRDRIMSLIGLQAQSEGEDIQNYFKRLGAAMGSGMDALTFGIGTLSARNTVAEFERIAAKESDPKLKAEILARIPYLKGQASFAQDIATAGIKVSRYLDNKREGFWDSAGDYGVIFAESIPTVAAAAMPYGAGLPVVMTAYGERNLATLRREAPNADPASLTATAYASGALEAGIDRVQWLTLGARVPKLNAKLLQFGKPGAVAVGVARAGMVTAAETGQEVLQDLTLPAVQEIAAALSNDIPGPNWSKVLSAEADALGDIAGVSLIFGIIGGAGSTVTDYMQAPRIAQALQARDGLALAGFSPETIEEVATMAAENPAAAAQTLQAAMLETPKEERQANAQAARDRLETNTSTRREFRATDGRVTSYGYASDETPDDNSAAGIGAWVSDEEADRIRGGEDTPNKLRAGDLAVSPDIEEQFRSAGISPGDPVTMRLDDGTEIAGRWMDRTDETLSGRFDLYSPDGVNPLDGRQVVAWSHEGIAAAPFRTAEDAGIPTMEKQADGRIVVNFPDAPALLADSPESALEAVREWEQAADVDTTKAVREYLDFLTDYHASNPEATFTGRQTTADPTLETWAGGNKERIAKANARIDIMMRQAGTDMGIDRPLLSEIPILGTSRNIRAGAITRMVAEINRSGSPLVVIEEAAESVGKWLMADSKVSESKMIGWIRQTEQQTRAKILADDIATMDDTARVKEIAEAFSFIAKNNAVGKIQDSALPAQVKAFFRAFKEFIASALRIAADFARLRSEGKVDAEFSYWLDVAAGLEPEFQMENLTRQMEAEQQAEAMAGFTEIQDALKGKIPHPDTLKAAGDPLAEEVRRLHEGMLENPENGANKAARTRKVNEFFLPKGTAGNLDELRRNLNEQGFDFQTPAEMIEAADLSINYGRKQYGTTEADPGAMEDSDEWEPTFSIGGPRATLPAFMRDSLDAARTMAAEGKTSEEIRSVTGWFPGRYDGKMRFEIPDQGAEIAVARDLLEDTKEVGSARLEQILDHPQLFEAYPETREIRVDFNPDLDSAGVFLADTNTIGVKAKPPGAARDEMRWNLDRMSARIDERAANDFEAGEFPTLEAALQWHQQAAESDRTALEKFQGITRRTFSTILHEIQHWIQGAEGFAAGGSPAGMPRIAQQLAGRIYATGKPSAAFEAMNAAKVADFAWLAKTWQGNPETLTRSDTWFRVKSMAVPKKGSPERAAYMQDAVQRATQILRDDLESYQLADFRDAMQKDREELRRIARNEWRKVNSNGQARAEYERMREIEYNQDPKKAVEFYRLLAGEIEARDVQARQDFTDEQRAAVAPYSSENIAEKDAIVIFDGAPSTTFSITLRTDPLLAAIEARIKSPEKKAEVYTRMKARVSAVKRRFEDRRLRGEFDDDAGAINQTRFEQIRDIAILEAIGKAMPPDIRGKIVGSFRKVADLKTTKGRAKYITALLPRIESALESSLKRHYRAAIRRQMKQAAFKVAESRTRGGKIGALGHAVFEEAKAAMKLTDDSASKIGGKTAAQKAEELADSLRETLEGSPDLSDEQIAELDGRISAVELFGDYGNADSARLEEALAFLNGTYAEGRKEWLDVLTARRDIRQARVAIVEAAMGREGPATDAERTAAKRRAESTLTRIDEAIMQAGLSGSQKLRRLAELSDDPEIKALTEDMEIAFLEAENQESDTNDADSRALAQAMRRIFNVSTEYGVAKKLRELTTATGPAPVEKIEGRKSETVKVPVKFVEAILAGELDALEAGGEKFAEGVKAFDDQDMAQLEQAWEQFTDLPETEQGKKRNVYFERITAAGARMTIGPVNQLEGLQLYLTMKQPDQAEKLARLGYDETTLAQLESWLKPETLALGAWMVNHIGEEAFTLDSIHRAEKGVGLKLVENYFPVRNDVAGADNTGLSINGGAIMHTGKSIGAIKERVSNNAPPAYVNAVAVFLANRAQVNFWKSHVATLREWGGVIRDERFAAAVKIRMGETYYQSLDTLLKRIESGGALNAAKLDDWELLIKRMTSSFAVGTLGGRVSTLAVNVAAGLNVGLEIPAADLAAGIAEVFARPEAFADAFNSPAIQRRLHQGATFEAQLAKSSGPSRNPTLATLNAAAQRGVMPINYVDTGANVIGAAVVWEHTRKQSTRAGMTEEEARAAADRAVSRLLLRSAQPTTRLARSNMELKAAENPLAALFTLFTSEPRKALAICYMAARELSTGKGTYGKPMAAQQLFVAFVIFQTADFMIRQAYAAFAKADDDEPESFLERLRARIFDAKAWGYALTTTHLRSVPIGGEVWSQIWAKAFDQKAFTGSQNPLNRATREILTFEKPETTEETIDGAIDILQGVGPVIPGGALFAQGGNVAEFVSGVATANGVSFSDEDRAARIKARFSKFKSGIDELHGKTQQPTGKTDKAGKPIAKTDAKIQAAKWAAMADRLRADLAPASPEIRRLVLDSITAPDEVKKRVAKELKATRATP